MPGRPGLIDDSIELPDPKNPKDEIPDFIQALENPDLRNPGTIAHMTLKLGGNILPPNRVIITQWPGNDNLNWDIPVKSMKSKEVPKGDSAVVLYWNQVEIPPNAVVRFGYAYGLGTVTSDDPAGSLGLTLGGSFEPGQSFTITAYVKNPAANQTLKLELPDGLENLSGNNVVPVPTPKKDNTAVVSWKAKVVRPGEFKISVKSSTGATAVKYLIVAVQDARAGGKFKFNLEGNIEVGQWFDVVAKVVDPMPVSLDPMVPQKLSLNLPPGSGLEYDPKEPRTKEVPFPAVAGQEVSVGWKVKLAEPGKYQIKVASNTGVTQTKTLTIFRTPPPGSGFQVDLVGDAFAPGKTFNVVATVPKPGKDQTLKLELPEGLEALMVVQKVPPGENSTVSWPVKVVKPGKYPIKVVSSTFIVVTKTLTINQLPSEREDDGRFAMNFDSPPALGKEFLVVAKVVRPVLDQKLTLVLPEGVKLLDAKASLRVPDADKNGQSTLTWKVCLEKTGTWAVKIESSTGQVKTKTITISSVIY